MTGFRAGDRVMALLPGGGYAEESVVDAGSVMSLPDRPHFEEGRAIETLLTVFLNVFQLGGLPETAARSSMAAAPASADHDRAREGAGGASSRRLGARRSAGAASSSGPTRSRTTAARIGSRSRQATGGRGVDVVLDSIGGPYLDGNLRALADDGAPRVIGLMGGAKAEIPLGVLLRGGSVWSDRRCGPAAPPRRRRSSPLSAPASAATSTPGGSGR